MERVLGVSGVFFRPKDPAALADWYRDHLGIDPAPRDMSMSPWVSGEGVAVFAPFPEDADYFPEDRAFMMNFRVRSLDAMLTQLRAAGVEPFREETLDGIGRFARIQDPEGDPVELWEPQA